MIRISRRPVTLLIALIAGLVLAGCGSGPSQLNAAAIIGDRTIPLGDVQHEVQWLLDNAPTVQQAQQQRKVADEARKVVRSRIVHELVRIAAEREGLRADRGEVDQLIQRSGGVDAVARQSAIEPERVRDVASDQILLQELGKRYADRVSVRLVGTSIVGESAAATAKEQARDLGRKIAADPGNVSSVVRDSGNQLINEELTLSESLQNQPELAISAVFGTSQGSVLVIQPSREQTGWLVALVEERKVSPAGKPSSATEQLDPQLLALAGLRQLQPIADELGVRVNPRYGVWDSTELTPVPSEEEASGYLLQSRTVQP